MADMFLKLDGVDGESTDSKHRGEIEIESFSWGLNQTAAQGGGGGGAGKVSVQDFHFVANTGIQSPPLLVATATGARFQKAMLTLRKPGERQPEYLKVQLEEVLVSSYQVGGSSGADGPIDQFSLSFQRIQVSVAQQRPDGAIGETVSGGYDLKANVKI